MASALVFTGQPLAQSRAHDHAGQSKVTVEDGLGNTVTSFAANVTVAIANESRQWHAGRDGDGRRYGGRRDVLEPQHQQGPGLATHSASSAA